MGTSEHIDQTNRSSARKLRLTKHWHNTEQRTVVADAAFARARVTVALMRAGGLCLIGNARGCTKHFCKPELKEEGPACERKRLACAEQVGGALARWP
jgi:hypothetical protein